MAAVSEGPDPLARSQAQGGTESKDLGGTDDKSLDLASPGPEQEEDILDRRAERALVWRLDLIFLFVGFLGYIFKYLDQTNISNAYVSGMKEDLKLFGNELNLFTTFFNAGYIIMLYPSCIIISHFGPGKWLPTCELMWGVLTCCLSLSKNAETVYGLRFLIGLFEATAWPGYFTLISQWYLPHEVALRFSLYNIAQPVGAMLSGALQGAISTNLHNHLGRTGWQWAFIINGVCTIFVAALGFFSLPGYPDRPNPLAKWYMRDIDYQTAQARGRRVGRAPQKPITVRTFARAFTNWKLWAFAIAWPFGMNVTAGNFFNLWLKSLKGANGKAKYTVAQLNYFPIGGQAVALVGEVIFSYLADTTGRHLLLLQVHSAINIASNAILSVNPSNFGLHMFGYYLNYVGYVSMMLLCAWASNHLQDEPEVRTILFSTGTTIFYIQNMFLPIVAFPAKEAPNWRIGASLYLGFACAASVAFFGIWWALRREQRKKATTVAGG